MTALVMALLVSGAFLALRKAYWGPILYYTLGILGPQYIWPWGFAFGRESMIAAAVSILAFVLHIGRGDFQSAFFKTRLNFWMLMLFLGMLISYWFGTYVDVPGDRLTTPFGQLEAAFKAFLIYFIATAVVDSERKVIALAVVILGSALYLIYWSNMQYLDGNPNQMSDGRLLGPFAPQTGASIYADENAFGVFFVATIPFVIYAGLAVPYQAIRWGLWAAVPLGWHAIFLTGSRGALVGLGASMLVMLLVSQRKWLALLLVPAFAIVFAWQAGDVMKVRSGTISEYAEDGSSSGRLDAWTAAIRMGADNPVSGVGISSFRVAFPFYSQAVPRDAHSVPFLYLGESGFFTLFAYLLVLWMALKNSLAVRRAMRSAPGNDMRLIGLASEATIVAFAGFSVCALFVSVRFYEIQFALLVMNGALANLAMSRAPVEKKSQALIGSGYPRQR